LRSKYFSGIDSFKGILIILVIIGHVVLGNIEENLARYIIYKFHMPLFLAITGYLITFKSLKLLSLSDLVEKYFYRMLLPWILAFIFFYVLRNFKYIISSDLTLNDLILSLLYPYYHLWYIPSVFVMVLLIWLLVKFKLSLKFILVSSAVFTVIWLATNENGQNASNIVFTIMGDKRTYYFFVYLFIGFYLRNIKYLQISKQICITATLFLGLFVFADFFLNFSNYVSETVELSFNISLIYLLLNYYKEINFGETIKNIGVNSLPIYLWHPLIILVIERVFQETYLYYVLSSVIMVIFIYCVIYLKRFKIINKFLFGNYNKNPEKIAVNE